MSRLQTGSQLKVNVCQRAPEGTFGTSRFKTMLRGNPVQKEDHIHCKMLTEPKEAELRPTEHKNNQTQQQPQTSREQNKIRDEHRQISYSIIKQSRVHINTHIHRVLGSPGHMSETDTVGEDAGYEAMSRV